jgi:hypothetical protein
MRVQSFETARLKNAHIFSVCCHRRIPRMPVLVPPLLHGDGVAMVQNKNVLRLDLSRDSLCFLTTWSISSILNSKVWTRTYRSQSLEVSVSVIVL